jgi:hypothetical protein
MVRNNESMAASSCRSTCGGYVSPEVVVVLLESASVLCSSVLNKHEGFDFDEGEDL